MNFHPVADIFPMMSDDESLKLAADIREHGQREPIWLHRDGRIIDGRNRYLACRAVGIEPVTRTYEGDDESLVPFALSLNLHRRHLNESQRAMVAARLANLKPGRPAEKPENLPGISQSTAAEMLNVSDRTLRDAKKVQEQAVPELAAMVDAGAVAVSTAATIAEQTPEEQREVIAAAAEKGKAKGKARDAMTKAAKEIKSAKQKAKKQAATRRVTDRQAATPEAPVITVEPGQWWQLGGHLLYCGDSADPAFIDRARGSAFAFADPPYNAGKAEWDQGFVWRHDYLADVATVAAVTPGISAIADFYAATAMPYRWSMAAWITNGMTRGALGFGNWIYLALFSTADSLHRNAQDHLRVTVDASTTGETAHASRKPAALMVELLHLFTEPGGTVVDPFLGSGTTLFAADQIGRRCVGAEIDLDHCREIIGRYGEGARPL